MMKKQPQPRRGIFEVHPGSDEWTIRYTDAAGAYHRELAGSFSRAEKLLKKRHGEAIEGKKLPELRRRSVPFSEIAEDCLAYSDTKKRSNRIDHSRMKRLVQWFGNMSADRVEAQEVERRFEGESWSAATRNRYRALLSLTFRLAIRNNKVKENPARLVVHQKESDGRTHILSVDEEKKLRQVIAEKFPERLPEFDVALSTGMRHGELYGAKWKDVDFEHRFITVIVYKTKNGAPRTTHVRLNDQAIRALLQLHKRTAETGLVCGRSSGATDWFDNCLKTAGITGFTWHCLRHTFASRLVMSGTDPRTVAELLRDKTLHMAMRYSHLAPDHTQAAVDRMGNQFAISTTSALGAVGGPVRVN